MYGWPLATLDIFVNDNLKSQTSLYKKYITSVEWNWNKNKFEAARFVGLMVTDLIFLGIRYITRVSIVNIRGYPAK